MNKPVLLDNTVLTNFALIRRPDLVLAPWPTACTTPATIAEYQAGVAAHHLPAAAWQLLAICDLTPAELTLANQQCAAETP